MFEGSDLTQRLHSNGGELWRQSGAWNILHILDQDCSYYCLSHSHKGTWLALKFSHKGRPTKKTPVQITSYTTKIPVEYKPTIIEHQLFKGNGLHGIESQVTKE